MATYWKAVPWSSGDNAQLLANMVNRLANTSYNGFKTKKACMAAIKEVREAYEKEHGGQKTDTSFTAPLILAQKV